MSTLKKIAIATGVGFVGFKAIQYAMGLSSLDRNFKYDITFNRIHRIYLNDAQIRATIIINIICYNGTTITLNAKNFSTSITSPEGYLLANTTPIDISIGPGQTYKREVEVDANIFGFVSSFSTSYKLKGINRLTLFGIPITTKPYTIDVGPYMAAAVEKLAWVKALIGSNKKDTPVVSGLSENTAVQSVIGML